jgi:predicted metal-dependent hydrolase
MMGMQNLAPKSQEQVAKDRRVIIAKERLSKATRYRITLQADLKGAEDKEARAKELLQAIEEVVTHEEWFEPEPAYDQT